MLKRIGSLLLALSIAIGAGACSSGEKKKTKTDDFSMTNVTSYEEKEIGAAIGLKNPGMKMELDSKNQLVLNDNFEKESFNIVADGAGKKLQEYKNDTSNGYGSIFTIDAQDNRYVVNEKYGTQTEGDKNREVTYSLIIYNSKGEKQKSFDLGKRTFNKEQAGITDIAVDAKGTVYLLVRRQNIEVIGTDGKKIKDIPAQKTDYIEIDEKDNLLIGSFNGSNGHSSVEKRNIEKEESLWTKEVTAGIYMQDMKYNRLKKTLYMRTDKGILSCSTDGIIEGFVLDFKQTSLLESGIYIFDFVFDSDKNIYVLATKMDSSSPNSKTTPLLYKYTPMKEDQKPKNQKTLTIALRYSDRYLEAAISKFQKAHPEIKVEIKDYKAAYMSSSADGPSEDENTRAQKAIEEYEKVTTTELMTGEGADIMEVMNLPYQKFIDKNALVNLSELIKNDSTFDINKYHQGILNACKYKDNLYIMPINFAFGSFGANKEIFDKEGLNIDSAKWTWKEFLTIAKKITKDKDGDGKPDQYALSKMTVEDIFGYMLYDEYSKFIDYDKGTAKFDSQEFIDLLNFTKDFSKENIFNPKMDTQKLYSMTDPGTIGFMQQYISGYNSITMNQALFNGEVKYLDMPTYSGNSNSKRFYPGRTFSINNKSEMKAEAWEFIKSLLSDEIQSSTDMYQFAINLNALKQQEKLQLSQGYIYDMYKEQGRKVKPLTQADIDLINKMIGELKTMAYSDSKAEKIVADGAKEFFTGKKSAQETAKMIQSKINIYLGE